jgi:hypothetical protein
MTRDGIPSSKRNKLGTQANMMFEEEQILHPDMIQAQPVVHVNSTMGMVVASATSMASSGYDDREQGDVVLAISARCGIGCPYTAIPALQNTYNNKLFTHTKLCK